MSYRKESYLLHILLIFIFSFLFHRRDYPRSEMETFSLLLLGLGLVLAGASESIMKIIKEELSEEKMKYGMTKSDQGKQTVELLMDLTLLYRNTSFGMSKDVMSS